MYSYEQDYYTITYSIQCNTGGQITQFCKVYEPSKFNMGTDGPPVLIRLLTNTVISGSLSIGRTSISHTREP